MKKRLNKIIAMLLISCLALSSMSINSFAAVGTDGRKSMNRGTGYTSFYQDGSLSAAYSKDEASEKYSAPAAGTYEGDLYQALKNFEDEIDVSKYKKPLEESLEAYRCLINANPDLFFVSNALAYYSEIYCENCGGYVAEAKGGGWLLLDETFLKGTFCDHRTSHNCRMVLTHWAPAYIENSKSQLSAMTAEFDAAVENALTGIDESMSDLEKALYCHDYLVKTNVYDYDNFMENKLPNVSHSAYGALVLRTSVCDGYSLAFSYLMKQCGINARLVTSDSMAHAWNAVEIDGSWYFVDLTNDDPICSFYDYEDENLVISQGDNYCLVCHNAFLASEELWRRTEYSDGCYNGWAQTDIICNNKKYDNAVWKTSSNEYSYCDGSWYYLQSECKKGDVNGDGKIDSSDALEILKYDVKINSDSFKNHAAALVNNDNVIDSSDALEILKYDVKLTQKLPTGDLSAAIMKTEDPANEGEEFLSLAEYKDSWGFSDGFYWPGIHTKVSVYAPQKELFFTTGDKIYKIDLTDSSKTLNPYFDLAITPLADQCCIFGMIIVDDEIYFGLQDNPNFKQAILNANLREDASESQ